MSGALISFCLMAVGARELSEQINTFQVLFFRSAIGLVIITCVIIYSNNIKLMKPQRIGLHIIRNTFHFAGQYCWFIGIGLLPLAEVFALEFTVPIWTTIIACFFLNEKITIKKVMAISMGILGVVVIVQPGIEIINSASFIVLGSAIFYSIAHTSTKALSGTENPLTILFLMCIIQLPIGFFLSIGQWQIPVGSQWLWLIVIGITALSAHYCMTKAMQLIEVSSVVTMDFFRLPVIAIVGVVFYYESFEITLILGALMMLVGNLINMYVPKKKRKIALSP